MLTSGPAADQCRRAGPVTFATIGLMRRDYDQYYRGFSNATLVADVPLPQRSAALRPAGIRGLLPRQRVACASNSCRCLRADDVIWVHDYHLIPFAQALRAAGVKNRIGFFLHIPFPASQVLLAVPPHRELVEGVVLVRSARFSDRARPACVLRLHRNEANGTVEVSAEGPSVVHAFGRFAEVRRLIRLASIRTRSPNWPKRASEASRCAR